MTDQGPFVMSISLAAVARRGNYAVMALGPEKNFVKMKVVKWRCALTNCISLTANISRSHP